jgi:2-iminoacetate synthase
VTFAPLYCSNICVNNCLYCGFRNSNDAVTRKKLRLDEIKNEVRMLAGKLGHKRLIAVYGEHPSTGIDFITESLKAIYGVEVKTKKGIGGIRRVNVNAAPMSIADLKKLRKAGIGTFQVFQETYHRGTYSKVHPANTIKGNFRWRLYAMHRALNAGIDDVGIGALFGLYDWKFEVMGLLYHSLELEKRFGIGPHTISFPRLQPAVNTPFAGHTGHLVSDEDFKKLVAVIRLAVPYTGMILTARESAKIRSEVIPLGITQIDAGTKIGIGKYSENDRVPASDREQFAIGDPRPLNEVIAELTKKGLITSFCTAGYRCGRTGQAIMGLLKSGGEGKFCKLNAIITFKEWLDDFGSAETKSAGEKLIKKEIEEVKKTFPAKVYRKLMEHYRRTSRGERDLFF